MSNLKVRFVKFSVVLLGTCALFSACKKQAPPPAPVVAKPVVSPEAALNEALAKLPEFVDRDMYKGFFNTAARCDVDVATSSVVCKNNEYFNNIVMICERGLMPRHTVMQAVAYVFENGTDKQKTAAAELLSRSYAAGKGTAPNKKVVAKLIAQLDDLPEPQAVDAAPAIADVAGELSLEQDLIPVLDREGRSRVAAAGYRRIMGGARMRVFEKLWDLVKSKNLDLAVAAVEAPRAMGGRTVEENQQVCDWMTGLTKDGRPVIEARAAAFLAGCGTKYLETVLSMDEKLLASGRPLSAGFDAYANACNPEVKNPYGNATKPQCARLKKLGTAVLNDAASRDNERVQALGLLTDQFPGKDTLALASKLAEDGDSPLSRKAQAAVRGMEAFVALKKN